jgi:hypothetical protein
MRRYKVGFNVNGKRFETIIAAPDTARAKEMILMQYPKAININITDLPN